MAQKKNKKTQPQVQPVGDARKHPQEGGMPRTGFDDKGATGSGSGLVIGEPGPVTPASPYRGMH